MQRPFWKSLPIDINDLPSRQEVLSMIIDRLYYGESTALTGGLRTAKTSLLKYLCETQRARDILLSYVDCQSLPATIDTNSFWEIALEPLIGEFSLVRDGETRHSEWRRIRNLFTQLRGERVALIIDEFDVIFTLPNVGPDLLPQLRSLPYSAPGFALIISSHYSLAELNKMISKPYAGSPYLNFVLEAQVRPLTDEDIQIALAHARPTLSDLDCRYATAVSGGNPFLLEVVVSTLWQQGVDRADRYQVAGEEIYRLAEPYFLNKWNKWDAATRRAITAIGLMQVPDMILGKSFTDSELTLDMLALGPEIFQLRRQGEIQEDSRRPGFFEIREGALLWWLADEILRTIREEVSFEEWLLRREGQDGSTRSDKSKRVIGKLASAFEQLLSRGASALIEAYARSLVAP